MFVNKIAPAQRQDLLLHEAAIRNDLSTARKLIGSVDINSKSQVTKDPFQKPKNCFLQKTTTFAADGAGAHSLGDHPQKCRHCLAAD